MTLPLPCSPDFSGCATPDALLRAVGVRALPLLVVYLESRRPLRLPQRVQIGVQLRPLACMDLIGATAVSVRLAGDPAPRVVGTYRTAAPDAPALWPHARSA